MPNKMRRVRGYITLRLSPGKDADLIAWWESLPSGDGAERVKQAIRESIQGTRPAAATAEDVEAAARWVVEQLRHLTPGPSPNSERGDADGQRLTDEEIRQRERTVRARRW